MSERIELIDDLNTPEVREALARVLATPIPPSTWADGMCEAVLALASTALHRRPKQVRIPEAVIPAPLTEVPESGEVWVVRIMPWAMGSARLSPLLVTGDDALRAVKYGLAYATGAHAEQATAAMLAREEV